MKANDMQVGGSHYKDKEVQPWEAIKSWLTPEQSTGYFLGSLIAYLARFNDTDVPGKGGMLDLLKAQHYLAKLIEVEECKLKNQTEAPSVES